MLASLNPRSILLLIPLILAPSIGCRTTPVTARRQMLFMPEDYETSLGVKSYHEILADETPSTNQHYIGVVNRVGQRIAQVAGRPDYEWEFRVIASGEQNAFCLPGGKVAVYEGILPICATESGIAVVMSHEIAHAIARHGGERMSQGMVANAIGNTLKYVTHGQEQYNRELLLGAYGAAAKYGAILPFSRKHETEADHIGIMLMAKAGYDPSVAPIFWQRFEAAKTGPAPPEFLSTHPASARRAADLRALVPEAVSLYELAPAKYGDGETIRIASKNSASKNSPAMPKESVVVKPKAADQPFFDPTEAIAQR